MKIFCFLLYINNNILQQGEILQEKNVIINNTKNNIKKETFFSNDNKEIIHEDNNMDYLITLNSKHNTLFSLFIFHIFSSFILFLILLIFPKIDFLMPVYIFYTDLMILINMLMLFKLDLNFFLFHGLCFLATNAILLSYFFFTNSHSVLIIMTFVVNITQILYLNGKITTIRENYNSKKEQLIDSANIDL